MQSNYFLVATRIFYRFILILQKSLLLQFIIAGVCFALLFPPFRTPDETPHFLSGLVNTNRLQGKAQIYCGKSVNLPHQFLGTNDRVGAGTFDITNMPEECTDAWTYGWLLNYPSVLVAKMLTNDGKYTPDRSLLLFYLSRILNGILIMAVFGRAFMLVSEAGLRSGVMLLFSFLLSALFMQQSWSVTADVPVNLLALYLGLILLYFPFLKTYDLVIFFFLGIIACSSKPVIAPLVPMLMLVAFFIYEPRKASWKEFLRSLLKNRFFLVGTLSSCLGIATGLFQIGAEKDRGNKFIVGQMEFVKANPWEVFKSLNVTLVEFFSHAQHFFYTPLGYFKLHIPKFMLASFERIFWLFMIVELGFLAVTVWNRITNRKRSSAPTQNGFGILLSTLLASLTLYFCALLPIFMMYLVWTPVGNPVVYGVQARYFYPMIFCAIPLLGAVVAWLTQQSSYALQVKEGVGTRILAREWVVISALLIWSLCYWMSLFHSIVLTYVAP